MDVIDKGIKARWGHRHLHVTAEAREQRPFHDGAVPAQAANPDALLKGLGCPLPAEGRAVGWVIEIVSEGESSSPTHLVSRCAR
jgi:hypothetical protein